MSSARADWERRIGLRSDAAHLSPRARAAAGAPGRGGSRARRAHLVAARGRRRIRRLPRRGRRACAPRPRRQRRARRSRAEVRGHGCRAGEAVPLRGRRRRGRGLGGRAALGGGRGRAARRACGAGVGRRRCGPRRGRPRADLADGRLGAAVSAARRGRRLRQRDRGRVPRRPGAAHTELGVERVRAHAILHDDLGVFTWVDDGPRWSFDGVDRVYDELLDLGLRPVVEVSFMPRDLARDPAATVFAYEAIVSPPRDWSAWAETCSRLAAHLVARYGIDEVARWDSRSGTSRTCRSSGRERRPSTSASTTRPPARSRTWTTGCPSAARRRPRRSGSRTSPPSPPTRRAARLRLHPHLRERPARPPGLAPAPRARRRRDLVDRVGRQRHPLRADPRHGIRRAVRAPRYEAGPGPSRRARLLGRQRPLRRARPAAASAPQRVRAAHGREPAQAALLGAPVRGRARRRAPETGFAATAPDRSSTRGPRAATTIASTCSSGTGRPTPPSSTATRPSAGRSSSGSRDSAPRRTRAGLPASTNTTRTSPATSRRRRLADAAAVGDAARRGPARRGAARPARDGRWGDRARARASHAGRGAPAARAGRRDRTRQRRGNP